MVNVLGRILAGHSGKSLDVATAYFNVRGFTLLQHGLILQSHILAKVSEATLVVAVAGPGLMAPPPPGPGQYRFLRWVGIPDETVEEPADLGNR